VVGGLIAWWASSRSKNEKLNNARLSRGTLIASGFIAGGSLFGVLNALLRLGKDSIVSWVGFDWAIPHWAESSAGEILGLVMFILLVAYALWDTMRAEVED